MKTQRAAVCSSVRLLLCSICLCLLVGESLQANTFGNEQNLPSNIPQTGKFTVTLSYSADVNCRIIVDLLNTENPSNTVWLAGDSKAVTPTQSGSVSFEINVNNVPSSPGNIKIKCWMVTETVYQQPNPWNYAIKEYYKVVTVGSSPSGPTTGPTAPPPPTALTGEKVRQSLGYSLLFYYAQRSGKLPTPNRVSWRGDTFLDDGKDNNVDLSGGYFDAGDHYKFNFPMAFTVTLLSWGALDYKAGYDAANQWTYIKDTIKWGTDYFLKCYKEETKELYGQVGCCNMHDLWIKPEDYTSSQKTQYRKSYKLDSNRPGADLVAETAAALTSASLVFKTDDPTYSATLLSKAKSLYAWALSTKGSTYSSSIPEAASFYNSWSGSNDEIVWAAAWLYRATGLQSYLNDADSLWSSVSSANGPISWDNKGPGAKVLLAQVKPSNSQYTTAARSWADSILSTGSTPGGLIWFSGGISDWGSNRHAMNAMFPLVVYADFVEKDATKKSSYKQKALQQLDNILGNNNQKVNYMVGAESSSPKRPHHRGSSSPLSLSDPAVNPNVLYGALVGGPDGSGAYSDKRDDYVKNEVALDYNAGFTGVLACFSKDLSTTTQPPTTTPPPTTQPPTTTPPPTTQPPTTTPPPPPPTTPPPPPPTTPPSTTTCAYAGGNPWWVEFTSQKQSTNSYVICGDGSRQDCVYNTDYGKYQCRVVNNPCNAPYNAYIDGACCSVDSLRSCPASAEIDNTYYDPAGNGDVPFTQKAEFYVMCTVIAVVVLIVIVLAMVFYKGKPKNIDSIP